MTDNLRNFCLHEKRNYVHQKERMSVFMIGNCKLVGLIMYVRCHDKKLEVG